MNAAELLREELQASAPFTKEELIERIVRKIKAYGRASYICDRHIRETQITGPGDTIRMADEQAATDFARSEGFHVSYDYNSYGVRYIIFTL
jgi:hypothetical protein